MELKLYLRILLTRWWIILLTLTFTLIPTYLFVNEQPWIYKSEATFVIRPRANFAVNDDKIVDALDTISRRVEINTTFAEVSSSSLIKQKAIESLGLTAQQRKGLKVSAKVIAGTNILEISVQGPDPEVVRDFTNAVSMETLAYISTLYDVFELEPLDEAELPDKPVSPNKTLNLALGASLGLLLGISLIFFIEYLKEPVHEDTQLNVIDLETGAYNETYLRLRLRQELSRARHHSYSFSVALVKVFHRGLVHDVKRSVQPAKAVRLILSGLDENMREEYILAYLKQGTFALLLPHNSADAAREVLTCLRTQVGLTSPELIGKGQGSGLYAAIGFVDYHQQESASELLAQALKALEEAETAVSGKTHLFTPNTTHPHHPNTSSSIGKLSPEASR